MKPSSQDKQLGLPVVACLIAACCLFVYIGSYKALCWSGCIKWDLRSEASYSIFLFTKTGDRQTSDTIARIFHPLIMAEAGAYQIFTSVSGQDNWGLGLYINLDEHGK